MSSLKDRIDALFDAAKTLNADQTDLTWCVAGKPSVISTDKFDITSSLSVSVNSQEYKQVLRMRLNVDEMIGSISAQFSTIPDDIGIPHLVRLLWCLAFFRMYSVNLVSAIESKIQKNLSCGFQISDSDMIMLLWSDAMLLQTQSVLDISLPNVSQYQVHDLINIMFAVTLVGKDTELIHSCREILYQKINQGTHVPADFLQRYNRLVFFSGAVLNEETETSRKFLIKLKSKAKLRCPWKYTFQLCLASHGTLKPKRLEVNPVVESVFPFDVSYTTSRRKILLEITRPEALVRQIDTLSVVGVDGYTRMSRLALAKLGYHIVNFSISEWTHGGDMDKKMDMIRRRVRNCLKGKRLFTGTERDTAAEDDSGDDGYSDDSDMSF